MMEAAAEKLSASGVDIDPHAPLGEGTFFDTMMTTPGHLWVYLNNGGAVKVECS